MKIRKLAMGLGIAMLAQLSMGQSPVITSFQGNGYVGWTNALNSNAVYRVEWASQAGGPWYRTFDNIGSLDGLGSTGFAVTVPMFYRVVATTNESPQGMVWIDGGDVILGQAGGSTTLHTNFVSGFWMADTEVTKAQWDSVAGWASSNRYDITPAGGEAKTNNHPVENVTWYECAKWCNARSQKEGLTPCYYTDAALTAVYTNGSADLMTNWVDWSANGYRLPTEAEWEKAARGGRQGRLFPWGGDTIQHARANYFSQVGPVYDTSPTRGFHPAYNDGVAPRTSPVGSFPANSYGLHDMSGNVSEWVWDWYNDYSTAYVTDPHGRNPGGYGAVRVFRGGSWNETYTTRCASRSFMSPTYDDLTLGFRYARGPQ